MTAPELPSWERDRRENLELQERLRASICPLCGKVIGPDASMSIHSKTVAYHSDCATTQHSREVRACKSCGFKRKVLVRRYPVQGEEYFNEYCAACEADQRARHYEREALRFRAKARALREKQARRGSS